MNAAAGSVMQIAEAARVRSCNVMQLAVAGGDKPVLQFVLQKEADCSERLSISHELKCEDAGHATVLVSDTGTHLTLTTNPGHRRNGVPRPNSRDPVTA